MGQFDSLLSSEAFNENPYPVYHQMRNAGPRLLERCLGLLDAHPLSRYNLDLARLSDVYQSGAVDGVNGLARTAMGES